MTYHNMHVFFAFSLLFAADSLKIQLEDDTFNDASVAKSTAKGWVLAPNSNGICNPLGVRVFEGTDHGVDDNPGNSDQKAEACAIACKEQRKGTQTTWETKGKAVGFSVDHAGRCYCNHVKDCPMGWRGWGYVKYDFTSDAAAKGDPHLINVNGDKFNVQRQGSAPLLKVSEDSDGDTLLKIMGRIEGPTECAQETMITALNISGSWLEKNVVVKVGDKDQAFHVIVDEQQVWSAGQTAPEYEDRMDFNAARAEEKYKRNFVFTHEAGLFSVEELDTSKTAKSDPGVQIQMPNNPGLSMKILRPMRHASVTPHLNLNVKGLGAISRSLKVGGLLGTDDHSNWSNKSAKCNKFARESSGEQSTPIDGSIATASYLSDLI